ncbi:hypothetical protein V3481_016951 [Fusarium oxysporum f. sp. vasinfectum]
MGFWNRSNKTSDVDLQDITTTTDHEKNPHPEDGHPAVPDDALPAEDVTEGVKDMEAITLVWTKSSLICLFIFIWLVYLLNAFQSSTVGNLVPYVTSTWGSHSLLNTIGVVASSMTAAVFIPLAKLLDLWGRAEGYLLMVGFCELGLILMATAKDLSTYCAANVRNRNHMLTIEANGNYMYSTRSVSRV